MQLKIYRRKGYTSFYEKININVNIQRNFYQTQFINKCARKKKLKSHIHRVEDYLYLYCTENCGLLFINFITQCL